MRVLVTRPENAFAPLARRLAARGHGAVAAPLMRIETVTPPDDGLAAAQAVLLTSANAARRLPATAARLPVFAVGVATAAAARAAGCPDVTDGPGDGASLAEDLAARLDPAAGPLVHYRGADARDEPGRTLAARGFTVRRRVVYRAVAADALPGPAAAAIEGGGIDAVLLFSPRSAAIAARLLAPPALAAGLDRAWAVCLSPAVAEAAAGLAGAGTRAAARPTTASLLDVLDSLAAGEGGNNGVRPPV